jgi:hypothetical protein
VVDNLEEYIMGEFGWLAEAASFLLAPLKAAFFLLKVLGLLAMGVVIFSLAGLVWLATPEHSNSEHMSYVYQAAKDSQFGNGVPLGNVVGPDYDPKIIRPHQAISFCGQGDKFLSQVMQNDYWDDWYVRKTGWLYQRYIEGSLNIYTLKYVVTQLKFDKQVVIGDDFISNCPNDTDSMDGKYSVPASDTTIPHFDVMWHLEGPDRQNQLGEEGFGVEQVKWPVITGYCLAGRCGKDSSNFLLNIDRWSDILDREPKYTSGQQEAIDAFKATRTKEFWEKYAEANGLDPHSVDKYWEETQKAIEATVHLKKVSSKELVTQDY